MPPRAASRRESVYQESLSLPQVREWILGQGGRMPREEFTFWPLTPEEVLSPDALRIRYEGEADSVLYSGSFRYSLNSGMSEKEPQLRG
ncbi:MAG: hypothetical protein HFF39_05105 [Lawsonibacter sp.]|nr:hypothetical protein [Lawsonibacter sp.]